MLIRDKISAAQSVLDTPLDSDLPSIHSHLTELRFTDEKEVRKIITQCQNKTCSLDPLSTALLQKSITVHLPYLVNIVNTSFKDEQFPENIKTALVKPLLKKDGMDADILENYRPVSNIPFLSKLLEKMPVKRLVEHLDQNELHEKHQSAYKSLHSTETALPHVYNDITWALDNNKGVVFVMLDLSAAFDTIDQNQVLVWRQRQGTLVVQNLCLRDWCSVLWCLRCWQHHCKVF